MDLLTAFIILTVLVAVFGSAKGKGKKRSRANTKRRNTRAPAKRIADREPKPDPYSMLYEHWKRVEAKEVAVPPWYHDPITEHQLNRLKEDGTKLPGRPLSKGQASDLIGLGEEVDPGQFEILKFFKVTGLPLKHGSLAAIEIDRLLSDPEKASKWINRPATPLQKEYYRYFNIPVPKGLTASEAEEKMGSDDLTDDQSDEWFAYSELIEELQDKDFREDYDLKKPSLPIIRQAIKQHLDQGTKLDALSADDLVDTILSIKPDLEKA
ncbi:hypothetical protein [Marinobacter adhaerens]|uniref:Uncharacterized protein n=2 Tax=Marinobacter adhaerens TaxID=1033846 RepID=A0ABX8IDQ8_9GAMM|nr:hypothetical protein [Marinobacter adhaerens]QWV11803.1 hypothetical protein KQ249_14040 [Marinobacter adhaerens]